MEKYVIDTNFFMNLEIKSGFGINSSEIVVSFAKIAKELKKEKKAEFYMPPRIIDEFLSFFKNEDFVKNFLEVITVKSPDVSQVKFPSSIFYQLVDEIRTRSYKGLRIAEEAVVSSAQKTMGKEILKKPDFERLIGEIIKVLREKYRQATRFNFLDSVADLDLIVLAKEIDGFLVSSDEGVVRWGRIFGVKELFPHVFKQKLYSFLAQRTGA